MRYELIMLIFCKRDCLFTLEIAAVEKVVLSGFSCHNHRLGSEDPENYEDVYVHAERECLASRSAQQVAVVQVKYGVGLSFNSFIPILIQSAYLIPHRQKRL